MMLTRSAQLLRLLVFVCLLGGAAITDVASGQAEVDNLIITAIDATNFPEVDVYLRVLDARGLPIANVVNDAVELTENGEAIAPDKHELHDVSRGLQVHFVLDGGVRISNDPASGAMRWQRALETVRRFSGDRMQENEDAVAVSVVQPNVTGGPATLTAFTGDRAQIETALDAFPLPRSVPTRINDQGDSDPSNDVAVPIEYSDPLPFLASLLDQIAEQDRSQGHTPLIVLVTPGLETGSIEDVSAVAARARELAIPIYVVLTRSGAEGSTAEEQLAAESNGNIATYFNSGDTPNVSGLYNELGAQRSQYRLSYRSGVNQSGTHNVEVRLPTGSSGGASLADVGTYDLELVAPTVRLERTRLDEGIVRRSDVYMADTRLLEPQTASITGLVIFEDGHERDLVRAELVIDGDLAYALDNPGTTLDLPWDLQQVDAGSHSLQVQVEDELGLIGVSPTTVVNVEFDMPPPPTSTPSTASPLVAPTPTPIPCLAPEPLCRYIEQPLRSNPLSGISLLVALASLVFAGFVWVNRGRVVEGGRRVGGAVTSFVERVTGRRMQAVPRAYVVVLEGDLNIGRSLEIYGDTPLGRSKQYAELLFQQQEENSPISRLHATIVDEGDGFTLRDEDSANGTYLNGMRLEPLQAEPLHDGDEIELAQVERGGVKLLFQKVETTAAGRQTVPIDRSYGGLAPPNFDEDLDDFSGDFSDDLEDDF